MWIAQSASRRPHACLVEVLPARWQQACRYDGVGQRRGFPSEAGVPWRRSLSRVIPRSSQGASSLRRGGVKFGCSKTMQRVGVVPVWSVFLFLFLLCVVVR